LDGMSTCASHEYPRRLSELTCETFLSPACKTTYIPHARSQVRLVLQLQLAKMMRESISNGEPQSRAVCLSNYRMADKRERPLTLMRTWEEDVGNTVRQNGRLAIGFDHTGGPKGTRIPMSNGDNRTSSHGETVQHARPLAVCTARQE
jgi:hypothetical protein